MASEYIDFSMFLVGLETVPNLDDELGCKIFSPHSRVMQRKVVLFTYILNLCV